MRQDHREFLFSSILVEPMSESHLRESTRSETHLRLSARHTNRHMLPSFGQHRKENDLVVVPWEVHNASDEQFGTRVCTMSRRLLARKLVIIWARHLAVGFPDAIRSIQWRRATPRSRALVLGPACCCLSRSTRVASPQQRLHQTRDQASPKTPA